MVVDILFIKLEIYCVHVSKKIVTDWHLCITQMKKKWNKWYAMKSHEIAYRSVELLLCTHTFNFDWVGVFLDNFN